VIDIEDIIRKEIEAKIKESIELGDMETIMKEKVEAINDEEGMINLVGVIRAMSRIFYEREYVQKEGPIYSFDEMRELLTQTNPSLKDFFNQLYLLAWPFERCEKTIGHSVGTSNEGLNTLANLGITTTARAVDRRKKQISEAHKEYIEKNGALNPKVVDDELIMKHLDERFIVNLGISYYDRRQKYIGNSSDNINTYNLPSLDYEITDRHLPRGFVTSRKPFTTVLCDYMHCDRTNCSNYSDNGKVLACGHGYHNYCLEKCNLKCLICFDYLQGEVSKNINALRVSMRKKLGENEFIEEDFGGVVEDDLDNSETAIDDAATIENLENAKKSFFEL
ncbi:33003_t:CDS:2, partial [Gigaspora margarita]